MSRERPIGTRQDDLVVTLFAVEAGDALRHVPFLHFCVGEPIGRVLVRKPGESEFDGSS